MTYYTLNSCQIVVKVIQSNSWKCNQFVFLWDIKYHCNILVPSKLSIFHKILMKSNQMPLATAYPMRQRNFSILSLSPMLNSREKRKDLVLVAFTNKDTGGKSKRNEKTKTRHQIEEEEKRKGTNWSYPKRDQGLKWGQATKIQKGQYFWGGKLEIYRMKNEDKKVLILSRLEIKTSPEETGLIRRTNPEVENEEWGKSWRQKARKSSHLVNFKQVSSTHW